MNPTQIRSSVIGLFGTRAVHSLQDGFVLGVLFGLSVIRPQVLKWVSLGLIGDAVGPKKLLSRADQFLRTEQIQENPEYFLIGMLPGLVVGLFVMLTTPNGLSL